MMLASRSIRVLLGMAAVLSAGGSAAAQQYKGIDLYTLTAPGPFCIEGLEQRFNPGAAADGQVVGYDPGNYIGGFRALLWDGSGGPAEHLNADRFTVSIATATDGVHQVGQVTANRIDGFYQAALWSGTPESFVNLHPAGFVSSFAYDVAGNQQVGAGLAPGMTFGGHALLWRGTPESVVDLHPPHVPDIDSSVAFATDGVQQVGGVLNWPNDRQMRAVVWNGTAASAVELHPAHWGFRSSRALGVGGGQQVGLAYLPGEFSPEHAVLWNGTAESAVDLHPDDLTWSMALATNGVFQVGVGSRSPGRFVGLLWKGTADSAIELSMLLPANLRGGLPYSIDDEGGIYGLAYDSSSQLHAVKWILVPEGSTLRIAAFAVVLVANTLRVRRQSR